MVIVPEVLKVLAQQNRLPLMHERIEGKLVLKDAVGVDVNNQIPVFRNPEVGFALADFVMQKPLTSSNVVRPQGGVILLRQILEFVLILRWHNDGYASKPATELMDRLQAVFRKLVIGFVADQEEFCFHL